MNLVKETAYSPDASPLRENSNQKMTPYQVFSDSDSKWPPDEDPGGAGLAPFIIYYYSQKPNMVAKSLVRSHQLFFSMGSNSKILFSIMGFSYPEISKKVFLWSPGVPMGSQGPFDFFKAKWAIFEQFFFKNQCFSDVKG